jgi:hypothetical protein
MPGGLGLKDIHLNRLSVLALFLFKHGLVTEDSVAATLGYPQKRVMEIAERVLGVGHLERMFRLRE